MLGSEAFARGTYEGSVRVAAGYPGTPDAEILEFLSKYHEVHPAGALTRRWLSKLLPGLPSGEGGL